MLKNLLTTVSTQIDQCMLRENAITVTTNSVVILQQPSAHTQIGMLIAERDAWHATSNGRITDSKKERLLKTKSEA